MHIEEQTGFGRVERNLFHLVNQLSALLIDFGAFEKLLFIRCGCFGQQSANIGFNLLQLFCDSFKIILRAFCSLIVRVRFLV